MAFFHIYAFFFIYLFSGFGIVWHCGSWTCRPCWERCWMRINSICVGCNWFACLDFNVHTYLPFASRFLCACTPLGPMSVVRCRRMHTMHTNCANKTEWNEEDENSPLIRSNRYLIFSNADRCILLLSHPRRPWPCSVRIVKIIQLNAKPFCQ